MIDKAITFATKRNQASLYCSSIRGGGYCLKDDAG